MSKPRYGWWGYVRSMIFRYPALSAQHAAALAQTVTPAYASTPGAHDASRGPERLVVKAMTRTEDREYEAVHLAIRQTQSRPTGELQLQLIRLIYIQRSHTLTGAALAIGVSVPTAKRWHGAFVRLVARNFGLLE